jgi:hypothetical protein
MTNEFTIVRCARCARVIDPNEDARIELASGRVKHLTLATLVEVQPFRRAWHERCFG